MDNICYLRKATIEDCDLIFEWANDEDERRNSFNPEKIPYETHCQWYKRKMESDDTFIFIYCVDQNKVGQSRIEIGADEALISYFISKENRSKGHGKVMLSLLKDKVKENFPQVKALIAQVKKDNLASQRVFESLGYAKTDKESCFYYRLAL